VAHRSAPIGGALALALVLVLPAGCGRGAPDLSDFDRSADKLCTESAAEQEGLRQDAGALESPADRARLLAELAERRAELAQDLSELDVSAEQADAVAGFVAAERRLADATEGAAGAAASARLRVLAAAHELNLEECAERLTPDARDEVVDVVEQAFSASDPEDRCSHYDDRYVAQRWGTRDECARIASRVGPRQPVDVFGANGIADVFATAAAHVGADTRRGFYELRLTFEDGQYKIDDVLPAGPAVARHGPSPESEGP
jgi:hypothetical protein